MICTQDNVRACRERCRSGPYDDLYRGRYLLWPARPGRMVCRAQSVVAAGRALDLGCGDGKNLLYLERLGWAVDGIDISRIAIDAARRRLHDAAHLQKGQLLCGDAANVNAGANTYDLIIAYGLYHCLDDPRLSAVHRKAKSALKRGGLLAFACFNDDLPVPNGHLTGKTYLRPANHIHWLCRDWRTLSSEQGLFHENHLPLIGEHAHAMTWALFQKV